MSTSDMPCPHVWLRVGLIASQPPLPGASALQSRSGTERGCLPRGLSHVLPGKPAPRLPAPSYLKETERKVLLLRRPSGRGAWGSPTESRRPAQPPGANEKLLVGVFPVQARQHHLWGMERTAGRAHPKRLLNTTHKQACRLSLNTSSARRLISSLSSPN